MPKMNSKEWSMCSRCPHRLVDRATRGDTSEQMGVEDEQNGREIGDIESFVSPKFVIDENPFITPTPIAASPLLTKATEMLLITNCENASQHPLPSNSSADFAAGFSSISPSSPPPESTSPTTSQVIKVLEQDLLLTVSPRPPALNNCELYGCMGSHWSDDSNDDVAVESEEEERDSPTKIKRIVGRVRKRVVRAFSGSEKDTTLEAMEKIVEVKGEDVNFAEELKEIAEDGQDVKVDPDAPEVGLATVTPVLKEVKTDVQIIEDTESTAAAHIEDNKKPLPVFKVIEGPECYGCQVGVCPGSRPR